MRATQNLGRYKMNGWDVARRAREIDPEFPVTYMTGGSADDLGLKRCSEKHSSEKPVCPGPTCCGAFPNF
jgi:hypothetical protein